MVLLKKEEHLIWLYALNPFIILEFSGNVHFEGVMIFFILLALYYLLKNQWIASAAFLGVAVQVKLIPLIKERHPDFKWTSPFVGSVKGRPEQDVEKINEETSIYKGRAATQLHFDHQVEIVRLYNETRNPGEDKSIDATHKSRVC